jgi:hypothetical protein
MTGGFLFFGTFVTKTKFMQTGYEYLLKEPGPKMLKEALALFGTHEIVGKGDNQIILDWAKEVGLSKQYSNDDIPLCGLFIAVLAKRAGKALPTANPLWALNWGKLPL